MSAYWKESEIQNAAVETKGVFKRTRHARLNNFGLSCPWPEVLADNYFLTNGDCYDGQDLT